MNDYAVKDEMNHYKTFFENLWPNAKPLATVFKTDTSCYLYDTGTNKIAGCNEIEYLFLEQTLKSNVSQAIDELQKRYEVSDILNTLAKIKETIETENIMMLKEGEPVFKSDHFDKLYELCTTSLQSINIEVTEQCNMRCDYCVHNSNITFTRNHGFKNIALSNAIAAIDYLINHSSKSEEVLVGFFGGEPLLRFATLKSCIPYAKKALKDKQIRFQVTTNGTLIDEEIAKYFAEEKIKVIVSIDGPKEIHDQHRKDVSGKGTFHKTLDGLQKLVSAYQSNAERQIELSMVYSPPYTSERLERISKLWDEYPWLKNINARITYPQTENMNKAEPSQSTGNPSVNVMEQWLEKNFSQMYQHSNGIPRFSDNVEKYLKVIHNRPIYSKPVKECYMNGCCLPAAKALFVNVNGDFYICEQVGSYSPIVGNLIDGLDFERLKKIYVDDYNLQCLPHCSRCWANKICTLCYKEAFDGQNLDLVKKRNSCGNYLGFLKRKLQLYCKLLENNPAGLDYLYISPPQSKRI